MDKGFARRGPEQKPASLKRQEPEWKLRFVRMVRIRQFSFQTEKSYLNWIDRFNRYWKTDDPEALGDREKRLRLTRLDPLQA